MYDGSTPNYRLNCPAVSRCKSCAFKTRHTKLTFRHGTPGLFRPMDSSPSPALLSPATSLSNRFLLSHPSCLPLRTQPISSLTLPTDSILAASTLSSSPLSLVAVASWPSPSRDSGFDPWIRLVRAYYAVAVGMRRCVLVLGLDAEPKVST